MSTSAVEPNGNEVEAPGSAQLQADGPVSVYKVVSGPGPSKPAELFDFRAATEAQDGAAKEAEDRQEAKPQRRSTARLAVLAAMLGVLAVLAFTVLAGSRLPSLNNLTFSKPAPHYIDMGNRRFDPAGVAGRLIVRWEESASYRLYLDPLDQQRMAGFESLAENPPHPLAVLIRLMDASGRATCQKEIVIPLLGTPISREQTLVPRTTPGGDTVQDMTGSDGQIAEITSAGPLPCSIDQYRRLTAWEFAVNFPAVAGQDAQQSRPAETGAAESGARVHAARGWRGSPVQFERLAAPVEGDDVIVGDNPTKGTVDTNSGRVFLVLANERRTYLAEWQAFPAAVHFRCEKTGACTLTHKSSRTMLQARLVR